jgi:hypothetical protein
MGSRLKGGTIKRGRSLLRDIRAATISRLYFDDNLLRTETETPTGVSANTVTYAYLADGNRDHALRGQQLDRS